MKGIILAGGQATRLYPITKGVCKQLLPVYDKPMIYYPLSVLMLAGIRDILVISTPQDLQRFQDLLGDGRGWGVSFSYAVQPSPRGIAEGLLIGGRFIGNDSVALILGDNIFYGHDLTATLGAAASLKRGALVFGYYVRDPERYGVLGFDGKRRVVSITEKPGHPASNWAVTGLYFYDNQAVSIAEKIKPSARGELEITSVNSVYLKKKQLKVQLLGRGFAWLDTGTFDSLMNASTYVKTIEERQGLMVGCPEEIAFRRGYIGREQLEKLAALCPTAYGAYLKELARDEK